MEDNGEEREGGHATNEEGDASESETEDDAILIEKNGSSSPRDNI